ncbi:MAG: tetratricopeptide repeat-containing serine/threonine-protein kinase [Acidobacteriota bacterium]|nr:tetratricopeptide repeat-containing serine/threonine-protein kinase [Acidobacteriota bacterium]
MTITAGTRLGPYEVVSALGAGGMGEVYRARDTRLGRDVAVKVLPASFSEDPERLRRFEQEARAAGMLNHPNLTAVYDLGTHEGAPYVVEELLEGETLRSVLAAGRLPLDRVVFYARQIADGLAAAHEKGVVHRDLKPENVFVTREGRIKILDFGIAKLTSPEGQRLATDLPTLAPATEAGVVLGTLGYMSPEQVRGEPVDRRSDLFSFGALLYEMLAGRRAFARETAPDMISAILRDDPPEILGTGASPSALDRLNRIARRCLEKRKEQRFQSAVDIDFALQEASSAAFAPGAVPGASARHRMSRLWIAAGLAVVAGAGILLLRGSRPGTSPGAAAPGPIRSLAVLPLENYSHDPAQQYFADGMTEELIADLAQIRSLRVISRTSAMSYRGTKKSVPEIARELNVDGILEGSVAREGNRVRITAQLIEGSSDRHVWARSYDRDLRDALSLQSEVARAVAAEVRTAVTPGEEARLARARPVDPKIHELDWKGRFLLARASTENEVREAIELFQEALQRDPRDARAYSGISDSYMGLTELFLPPSQTMPKARAAALRAIELDETLAEAHASLGQVLVLHDWDWAGAQREFQRALELNPNYASAHSWYGNLLAVLGRPEESAVEMRTARDLDPLSADIAWLSGWDLLLGNRVDLAVQEFRRGLTLDPNGGWLRVSLAIALVRQGRAAEAIAEAEKGSGLIDSPLARAVAGGVFAEAGDLPRARRVLGELEQAAKTRYVCPYEVAVIHIGLGEKDQAIQWLERGYRERSTCMPNLKCDWRLTPLHGDPRFRDLLARLAFPANPAAKTSARPGTHA